MTFSREELILKLGLQNSSNETQDYIISELISAIDTRIMVKLSEKLSQEDLEQLNHLAGQNDEGAVEWYIKSRYPNYDEFVAQTENEVIDETAANIKSLSEAYQDPSKSPASQLNL